MPADSRKQKKTTPVIAGWSASGFVIGFAIGYLLLDGIASGVILGIGLGLAMGIGGKEYSKKGKGSGRN